MQKRTKINRDNRGIISQGEGIQKETEKKKIELTLNELIIESVIVMELRSLKTTVTGSKLKLFKNFEKN